MSHNDVNILQALLIGSMDPTFFLEGMETLKNIDYIYCEVNRDEVYENNAFVEELDEFLSQYNMERVETSWDGTIWGDALYVRRNLL